MISNNNEMRNKKDVRDERTSFSKDDAPRRGTHPPVLSRSATNQDSSRFCAPAVREIKAARAAHRLKRCCCGNGRGQGRWNLRRARFGNTVTSVECVERGGGGEWVEGWGGRGMGGGATAARGLSSFLVTHDPAGRVKPSTLVMNGCPALHPHPLTPNPKPQPPHSTICTLQPQPYIPNPTLRKLHPNPNTPNPQLPGFGFGE